jgi:tripartite-type tricarboxylate transporter receptor subunit TctC
VPVKDVKDLVAQLKAKPDKYTYASAGNGTAPHYAAELFKLNAGVVMTGRAVQGLGAGDQRHDRRADAVHVPEPVHGAAAREVRQAARAGGGRPKRSALLPEVPTLKEAGVDGVDVPAVVRLLRPGQDAQGRSSTSSTRR